MTSSGEIPELAIRKTSRDRSWSGFAATIYDTPGGYCELPASTNHELIMHIGPPVMATCRHQRDVHRRLQVPGDMAIIAAGQSATWVADGPSTIMVVAVAPSLIRSVAWGMGLESDAPAIEPHLHLQDAQLAHLGWALKAELEADDPIGRLYADSLGLALVAHFLHRSASTAARSSFRPPRSRIGRACEYIRDHPAHDLSVTELAKIVELSPSYFKVLFKQSTGMAVHRYVVRSRVEYARTLLLRGSLTLSAIASQAGFADQSHMRRCMRRVSGFSPTAPSQASYQQYSIQEPDRTNDHPNVRDEMATVR
jgi:AraC family transcriptional regulator